MCSMSPRIVLVFLWFAYSGADEWRPTNETWIANGDVAKTERKGGWFGERNGETNNWYVESMLAKQNGDQAKLEPAEQKVWNVEARMQTLEQNDTNQDWFSKRNTEPGKKKDWLLERTVDGKNDLESGKGSWFEEQAGWTRDIKPAEDRVYTDFERADAFDKFKAVPFQTTFVNHPFPQTTYGVPSQPPRLETFEGSFPPPNSPMPTTVMDERQILYMIPGKCSNSIEVLRIKDIEVKTIRYGQDQTGLCVLMLYTPYSDNKLAISFVPMNEDQFSTDSVTSPMETVLEESLKLYSLTEGSIVPVIINFNFGKKSPALILSKSSIVLLSINANQQLDFYMDVSTYKSPFC